MLITFNPDKTRVNFVHEDAKEYIFLNRFPGFLKGPKDQYFHIPAKAHVLYNIYNRLRKAKKSIKVAQDVLDFMNQPFVLKPIPASFQFVTSPMDYQEIALRYLYTVGSGGLLLDPGMGKSKVVLDYIALMGFKKTIIVCPKPLLFVWEDEIAIHRPELTFYTVRSTNWEEERDSIVASQVTIINYNKAITFLEQLKRVGYEFIHLDEFLIKDPSTDRTKGLTQLSYIIPYKAGGSGTLINNSVRDVFAPVRYLEASLVGQNSGNFLNHFAVKKKAKDSDRQVIVGFKHMEEARSILESCCIVMTKDKWLKLPEKNFHDIYVPLTDEQRRASGELVRNRLTIINGTTIEIDNALVLLSKLYQISNGFVYWTPPGEESEHENEVNELLAEDPKKKKKLKRQTIFFEDSAKIEALRRLICETIPERKAIIWFNMEAEYVLIKEMLEREGKSFLTIKGGETRTGEKVRTFNKDPSIQYLVCQARSVNYGITVLGTNVEEFENSDIEVPPNISPEVHTEIFYSMNFSLEVYLQQQDRIHRLGQKHTCDYYRIFATSPVEKRIREAIADKLTLRHSLLIDIAEKLQKCEDEMV